MKISEKTKQCKLCLETKPTNGFYADKQKADGRATCCKVCRNKKRNGMGYSTTWKHNHPERALYNQVKQNARQRNEQFDLKPEDIRIPETCPVLGIPLFYTIGARTDNTPSVDRVDNSVGYTKDNTRVVSWRANQIKRDATLQELEKLVEYLKRNLSEED